MQDKIVLVTGATDGIGKVAARELARQGATVIVAGRNPDKTEAVAAEIRQATGNTRVSAMVADLSAQQGVRALARQVVSAHPRLDVLLNNAGAIFSSRQVSADGIEMTWALNHLNYFLLTHLLLDALKAAPAARVVNVSSDAHQMARMNFDDLQATKRYTAFGAYGQSKLANVMFTYELARRLAGTPITINALHPGAVATGFGRNNGGMWSTMLGVFNRFSLTPDEGAKTSIYLASSPDVAGVTAKYFASCKEKSSSKVSYDVDAQRRLWDLSAEITRA